MTFANLAVERIAAFDPETLGHLPGGTANPVNGNRGCNA